MGSILPPTSPPPPRGGGHLSTSGDDVDRHKWEIQWVETRDATKHLTWHKVTGPTTNNDLVLSILWVSIMSVAKPVFHFISSCLAPLQIFLHDGAAGLHGSLSFTLFCVCVCVFLSLCLWHRHDHRRGRGSYSLCSPHFQRQRSLNILQRLVPKLVPFSVRCSWSVSLRLGAS